MRSALLRCKGVQDRSASIGRLEAFSWDDASLNAPSSCTHYNFTAFLFFHVSIADTSRGMAGESHFINTATRSLHEVNEQRCRSLLKNSLT